MSCRRIGNDQVERLANPRMDVVRAFIVQPASAKAWALHVTACCSGAFTTLRLAATGFVLTLYIQPGTLAYQEQAMAGTPTRSTVINLRADEPRRALIDRAAEAVGKNRSEFML